MAHPPIGRTAGIVAARRRMIEQTVLEQQRATYWHRQCRDRQETPRRLLHESDELMYWLEECLVQGLRIVPGWLMPRLIVLLARADPQLPRTLSGERRPAQIMEFLYRAQSRLMDESLRNRQPAKILRLFP
jgi:hypothetical protein